MNAPADRIFSSNLEKTMSGTTLTLDEAITELEGAATDLANAMGPQQDPGPSAGSDVDRIRAVTAKLQALQSGLTD